MEVLKLFTKYRELFWIWTMRDIKVRYKQSILGGLWAILQPLALMVIFSVVFSYIMKVPSDNIPYPIFSYTALLPWTFFTTSITFAFPSLLNNSALLSKIHFPREIFPISSIAASFFDFLLASLIFVGMMFYYHIQFKATLLLLPMLLLIQIILTIGITLFASGIIVFYRDVRFVMPLLIQIWMYATPIIYPISAVPKKLLGFYLLNPMAILIESYRDITLRGVWPDWSFLGLSAFISLVIFVIGYMYFEHVEWQFADII